MTTRYYCPTCRAALARYGGSSLQCTNPSCRALWSESAIRAALDAPARGEQSRAGRLRRAMAKHGLGGK